MTRQSKTSYCPLHDGTLSVPSIRVEYRDIIGPNNEKVVVGVATRVPGIYAAISQESFAIRQQYKR